MSRAGDLLASVAASVDEGHGTSLSSKEYGDLQKAMDKVWARKPNDFDDMKRNKGIKLSVLENRVPDLTDKIPYYTDEELYGDSFTKEEFHIGRNFDKTPDETIFVMGLIRLNRELLVDTQGFDNARYIAVLRS